MLYMIHMSDVYMYTIETFLIVIYSSSDISSTVVMYLPMSNATNSGHEEYSFL